MLLGKTILVEVRMLLSLPSIVLLLAMLLALNLILMSMHVLQVYMTYYGIDGASSLARFDMDMDGSCTELLEYALNAVSIAMLAACWLRTRQPMFLALCVVFLFTLMDNAFQLHERFGKAAAPLLQSTSRHFDAAPTALGELIFYMVAGPALLLFLVLAMLRSSEEFRARGAVFVLLLLMLGGFGVGVDLIHSALLDFAEVNDWTRVGGPLDKTLGFVEDGGEMVILSLICALSCAVYALARMRLRSCAEGPARTNGAGS